MKACNYRFWSAGSISLCCLIVTSSTQAQIVPDTTLPNNSIVSPNCTNCEITGGTEAGNNLFHSFEQFSIPTGGAAYFNNAATIENIISRVTGNSVSSIDGLIHANAANLFLINPKGIIFGPNAQLNIGGSFVASTASSLNFADGTQFSATAPQTTPLLTVSVPIGLQFGETAGRIVNRSIVGLQVQSGQSLALVGGDVVLEGGSLTAVAGRIELGSVAGGSLVSLDLTDQGLVLRYEGVQNFQDIRLIPQAVDGVKIPSSVNASGERGGNIQVQGRHVMLTGGSQILTASLGTEPGGNLTVNASEFVELNGSNSDFGLRSGLISSATAVGGAGNITLTTRNLLVQNGAIISTSSAARIDSDSGQIIPATGPAGALTVNASDLVEIVGTDSSLSANTRGAGDAGDLTINTDNLIVRDGAGVTVSSEETGDAGDLKVTARSILLNNQGNLTATTESGKGGNITINTDTLVGIENSDIRADANNSEGGVIKITAQGIFGLEVRELNENTSDINADSRRDPSLNGEIEINTPEVDPSQGLVNLPEEVVDATGLVARGCPADTNVAGRGGSKFTVTGRGGLPPTPQEALNSDAVLEDWGKIAPTSNKPSKENQGDRTDSTPETPATPDLFVPATGWVISANGEVTLTAQAPTVTPQNPSPTPASCNGT